MNINYKSLILAISLFFALSASISAAPGDLDPTFGNGGNEPIGQAMPVELRFSRMENRGSRRSQLLLFA